MPNGSQHTASNSRLIHLPSGAAFQLAQGGAPSGVSADAPAQTAGSREQPFKPGDMADPRALLWDSGLIAVGMIVFALLAKRNMQAVPRGLQNVGEFIAEGLNRFAVQTIGPGGERYTPLVGTIFIYVLLMNLFSAMPFVHAPTANLTFTLALGVVVFVYVQFVGIRSNGPVGYVKHFLGPIWWVAPLLGPIELVSELVKPFTLALRLFGNIFGEDVIILILASMASGSIIGRFIPLQFPVLILSLLTDVVQALVFTILTCIYIQLMTGHGSNEHEAAHAAH
ncbi:MAG: F0F1 ATP synthase subunit A [Armatimonadetes bacterium]|nr:F0F1 ATP synthase subunit A [Armatimonadota bacterium]MDE2205911.1 F0F1 ATP synthase subunit A [Armatimonadota bacterium]